MELSREHCTTLHVLAFLYFRMGRMESATRIYAALAALNAMPQAGETRTPDWRPLAGQAAVALEQEDGETALPHIRAAMELTDFLPDAPEGTILNRMYAKALWLSGNKEEARAVASVPVRPDAEKVAS